MPKEFEKAVEAGAKVRTISLPHGKYMRVAIRPKGAKGPRGGRTVSGEVKKKKNPGLADA